MSGRFFSFGCSFTAFAWPTWPDFIGTQFPENYYNYGRSGAGNVFIFHRFIEANEYHKFDKNDLIIIQWTDYMREDRYLNNWWHSNGNITNAYPLDYVKKYVDPRGFLIRDLTMIAAVTQILDGIGCEYHFLNLNDFSGEPDILDRFDRYLKKIKPSYLEVLGPRKLRNLCGIPIKDLHPIPSEHYRYLETVLPEWLPDNKNLGDDWDNVLAKHWYSHKEGWDYTWPGIDRGFEKIFREL